MRITILAVLLLALSSCTKSGDGNSGPNPAKAPNYAFEPLGLAGDWHIWSAKAIETRNTNPGRGDIRKDFKQFLQVVGVQAQTFTDSKIKEVPGSLKPKSNTWFQNDFGGGVGTIGWGWDDLEQGGDSMHMGFVGGRYGQYWIERETFTPLVGEFAVMYCPKKGQPWSLLRLEVVLCPVPYNIWYSHGFGKSPK